MASVLKRLFGRQDTTSYNQEESVILESEKPYIITTLYYLAVILFIGVPVWFYTCSSTRYSLPNLTKLEGKLVNSDASPPRLHLDISVVQLARYDSSRSYDDYDQLNDNLTNYLRTKLPSQLETFTGKLTYNINWRVRRPTHSENEIFQPFQLQQTTSNNINQVALTILENQLLKIHKSSNKFRLFIYLIEEQYYPAYCDPSRPHTYTISFERFVYLCPSNILTSSNDYSPTLQLINNVLNEVYVQTVNEERVRQVLNGQIDLLISLIPESTSAMLMDLLANLADQIHQIYDKNVKDKFLELKELVNVRLITQNLVDVLDEKLTKKILKTPLTKDANSNSTNTRDMFLKRVISTDKVGSLFHKYESRLSKHSSQNVYNVLSILPDPEQTPIVFKEDEQLRGLSYLEVQGSSLFVVNDNKSLVLNLRAIFRRAIGLSSVNICENCLVRRDVFLNRWEIDALMGILTISKLQSTLISLRSISQRVVVIKIPKEVSIIARESYALALKSIEYLETKQPLEAYRSASKAFELSEQAFFDPSLLESLYFPDDLKYAIYSPLLLPLALLLIPSMKKLSSILHVYLTQRRTPKLKIN